MANLDNYDSTTRAFILAAGEEACEAIGDAIWNKGVGPKVTLHELNAINACNHEFSAEYTAPDGKTWFATGQAGDIHGFWIYEFSDAELPCLEERVVDPLDFRPQSGCTDFQFINYLRRRGTTEFADKVAALRYDSHFAPGCKTRSHYLDWATARGMRLGIESAAKADIASRLNLLSPEHLERAYMMFPYLREGAPEPETTKTEGLGADHLSGSLQFLDVSLDVPEVTS